MVLITWLLLFFFSATGLHIVFTFPSNDLFASVFFLSTDNILA